MAGWSLHKGQAVALPAQGIDTDQLIPARFMTRPRSEGYGPFLLHDQRFEADGRAIPAFPLNRHQTASVLVTGRNFGTGSSREAAVYALADFGIRAVIAPSFGDIFAGNAVNNGLLPASVDESTVTDLITSLGESGHPSTIDLQTQTVRILGHVIAFAIEPVWRTKLMEGWDDIDLTQNHLNEIASFRRKDSVRRPWAQLSTAV